MLYAKLRYCRILQDEVQYYENALLKANAADPLTNAGKRHRNKIPGITTKLNTTKKAFLDAKEAVLADEGFKEMLPYMKEACIAYYLKNKTEVATQLLYKSTSFLRDVRNYCHRI